MKSEYKITLTEWQVEEIKEAARYLQAYKDLMKAGAGEIEKEAARIAAAEAALDAMEIFNDLPNTPF